LGQNAKYSLRADVFRFTPDNRHQGLPDQLPVRADTVAKVFLRPLTQIFRAVRAAIE
jgi:hypothetical protein